MFDLGVYAIDTRPIPDNALLSYVDLLCRLHAQVETDNIPAHEKREIMRQIEKLEQMLWKYSA